MFRPASSMIACMMALSLASSVSAGTPIESTFDSNDEGWRVVDLTFPAVGNPPPVLATYVPVFSATDGSPGGHVSFNDPSANVMYWKAPPAYLGNQSDKYDGTLTYSLRYVDGSSVFEQEDVVLVGDGLSLVFDINSVPGAAWFEYRITLHETGWRIGSLTGPNATPAQMRAVLASLTALYIRGEFRNNLDDTSFLDTVRMTPGNEPPAEPCIGDANGDGQINFNDLAATLSNWGLPCP